MAMFRLYPIEPNTEKRKKLLREHANCWEAASVFGVGDANPPTWEALAEAKWNGNLPEPDVPFGMYASRIKALWEERIRLSGETRHYGGINYERYITALIDWVEIRIPPYSTEIPERTALFQAPEEGSRSALWRGLESGDKASVLSDVDIYARIQHQMRLTRLGEVDVVCYAHDLDAISVMTVPMDIEYQKNLFAKWGEFLRYYPWVKT